MKYRVGRCQLLTRIHEAGKIQQDLADDLGYSRSQVSKWVNGGYGKHIMSPETQATIAFYLGGIETPLNPVTFYDWIIVEND
ncbi:helix-turn-helix domain-containing protein [Paenibacillus alba]|uniref:Helix-turn-helix transcriptional regulator n=1 Tax=Paenibacillus alba TaxID=1197127 RepID=A0ABU6GAN8_9BACL|nr:helix-turn-helix transcriptional regulator [Paenibacillus alba]MEC0231260.1 helix-turn-helix transcriptional regulator [Paenibacillus alba]